MKIFLLCITISFFAISCSSDEDLENIASGNKAGNLTNEKTSFPNNPSNPFDQTGVEFYNKLRLYIVDFGVPNSTQKVTNQMLFLSKNLKTDGRINKSVIKITPEMIGLILADPQGKLVELIETSTLSLNVKNNLTDFVSDLVDKQDDDYDEVYSFIVSYESDVIDDVFLEEDEKDTILKVSSISRYSLYEEARNRDRDWETSVTNKKDRADLNSNQITLITLAVLFNTLN